MNNTVPKNLRTLKTNFEEADGLGISFILIVGLYNRFPRLFFLLTLHQNETTLNFVKMCHEVSLLQMAHFASKCAAVSIMFSRGVD